MVSSTPVGVAMEGVERRYGDEIVLNGIDLMVEPGECVALLGPSGCGKTTLLRAVAGLDAIDGGEIRVGGELFSSPGSTVPPERRGIGMVFQDGALFPHLSVARNVGFGLPKPERRSSRRIDEMLRLVGLDGMHDRLPEELSGGEAQRVALARALAPAPRVLLLDEPFSNLDSVLRRRLRDDVRSIVRDSGVTTLFVTHDRDEAFRLGDQVAVMRAGVIAQLGPPAQLYRRPADPWIADFLGDARWCHGHVVDGRFDSQFGSLTVAGRGDGPARLLVRPEDLVVVSRGDGAAAGGMDAVVVDVEFAGATWFVTAAGEAGYAIVVRVPGDHAPPVVGSTIRVTRRAVDAVVMDPS